jgi:hypothetical protein
MDGPCLPALGQMGRTSRDQQHDLMHDTFSLFAMPLMLGTAWKQSWPNTSHFCTFPV